VPIVDDPEITRLVGAAIYYLEQYITRNARGDIQGLTLWLALVNVEHAILCLRLTDRVEDSMSGSANRASSHKKSKEVRPRKQNSSETYTIGKSIEEITLRLANVKNTSKSNSAKLLSELRACRDILVKAIRRHSSIS
jgi:hypothetical protein